LALGCAALVLPASGAAATAPLAKPLVKTGVAASITYQSATLGGTVDPASEPTTYFFEYGPTTKFGSVSAPVSLAAGKLAVRVESAVAGLQPVTKYYFRIAAVSAGGSALGATEIFTTTKIPLSVGITALPDPTIYGAGVTVAGTVSGTGGGNREVILQENPYPYTAGFENVGNPALTSADGGFSFALLTLPMTTQFRVVSVGGGQSVGSAVTTEDVALGVSTAISRRRTKPGSYTVRFSGEVSPAEVGARVGVERLVGRTWKFVEGSNAGSGTPTGSPYSVTIHVHHGGFYRVRVDPVEGGHVIGYGPGSLVRLAGLR
jgi:hypothetical protein